MKKSGRRSHVLSSDMKADLEKAGFVDIRKTDKKQPLGPWPKDPRLKQVGSLALVSSESAFHAYGMGKVPENDSPSITLIGFCTDILTRILEMPSEEAEKCCNQAVKHTRDKHRHTYSYL